jgi:hypothetical protein
VSPQAVLAPCSRAELQPGDLDPDFWRAGVERAWGSCCEDEVGKFFRLVPAFERSLVRSGTIPIKHGFSITDEAQHLRFSMRIADPLQHCRPSPIDVHPGYLRAPLPPEMQVPSRYRGGAGFSTSSPGCRETLG